jgi:hypothetical protein
MQKRTQVLRKKSHAGRIRHADRKAARRKAGATRQKSAGANRSEGIRLFAVAGRPSKEDFVKVYGPAGPKMTWDQRAKAGVPAEKFQAALASAMRQAK